MQWNLKISGRNDNSIVVETRDGDKIVEESTIMASYINGVIKVQLALTMPRDMLEKINKEYGFELGKTLPITVANGMVAKLMKSE